MGTTKILLTVLFATLTLSAMDALAKDEIYRWVDENGVVHFGDRSEGQPDAELVDIKASSDNGIGSSAVPAPADPDQQAEPQPTLAEQRRAERAAEYKEAAEKRKAVTAVCEESRQRVATLEPSPKVLVRHEDGTVDRLDDNKRLELLAEAKAYIAENCN